MLTVCVVQKKLKTDPSQLMACCQCRPHPKRARNMSMLVAKISGPLNVNHECHNVTVL